MNVSFGSCLGMGVATITAVAVAVAPSVVASPSHPTPSAATVRVTTAPVHLAAAAQPAASAVVLPNLLVDWVQRIVVPPSAGAPFPKPVFPPVIAGSSIDSTIKNVYNAVEPWVRYGFELGAYALGWVPYVGWLSPQVMIFYDFGERIVRSITFNVADWLGGKISFLDGLINVGIDVINSFIELAKAQLNFWLPSLPPLPPIGPFAAAETTSTATTTESGPSTLMSTTTFARTAGALNEPQPTEPEPEPTEPDPTEPDPTEPDPTEPDPTEPEPTEPESNTAPLDAPEPTTAEDLTAAVLPQVADTTENLDTVDTVDTTEKVEAVEKEPTTTTNSPTTTTSNGVSAQGEVRTGNHTVVTGGAMTGVEEHSGAGRVDPQATASKTPDPEPADPATDERPDPPVKATPQAGTTGTTEGNQSAAETKDDAPV
jgi:hypothetical protein